MTLRADPAWCQTQVVSTTIRTSCAACGPVEVEVLDAQLLLGVAPDKTSNRVEFTCPRCAQRRSHEVGERATRLLAGAGVGLAVAVTPPASIRASDAHDRGDAAT